MEIVEKFKAEGKTVIITSHDPLVYESAAVDRVVNLRDGKIEGEPAWSCIRPSSPICWHRTSVVSW